MHRFEVIGLLAISEEALDLALSVLVLVVLVPHGVDADVEGQANGLRRVLHIAAALHDVLRGDVEGCRTVLLLEAPTEIALMVVLPLDDSVDLVHKFGGRDPLSTLIHRAHVGALARGVTVVVEEAAARVARLVPTLRAYDVENKGVTGYLLVHLDLDDVAALDLGPIGDDESTRLFEEDEALDGLVVHRVGRLLQFVVRKNVYQARPEDTDSNSGHDMRVVRVVAIEAA